MDPVTTKIIADGQLVISAPILVAMNLVDGDMVSLTVRGKALEIVSLRDEIAAIQTECAPYRTSESMVDSLIADRRAEAAKEFGQQ